MKCPNCGHLAKPQFGLTERQRECLDFIAAYTAKHGISPSYEEIKNGLKTGSKSKVYWLIRALEERGHIIRLPYRRRSLCLVE